MPPTARPSRISGACSPSGASRPSTGMGQNFLIDLNIHDLIVKTAEVGPDDVILEVGPGAGALTALMAGRGAAVVAVEIDPGMASLTAEAVAGLPNVRVLNPDALASKNTLNPERARQRPRRTGRRLRAGGSSSWRTCPTTSRPRSSPTCWSTPSFARPLMVVTIQRELAERMIAAPSTSAYGALSILVQALADVSIVRILPPSVFWPRPKVDSAVVMIRPVPERRAGVRRRLVPRLVRQVFLHRRKNLRHVLAGMWDDQWTKADVEIWLESQGLNGQLRAEALRVEEIGMLADALKKRWGSELPGVAGEEIAGLAVYLSLPFAPHGSPFARPGIPGDRSGLARSGFRFFMGRGGRIAGRGCPLRRPELPSSSTNSARSDMAFQIPASSSLAVSG